MTVKGVVKDGVVVLEDGVKLHDGTEVRVEVPPPAAPLFSEKLMKFGGSLRGGLCLCRHSLPAPRPAGGDGRG